MKKTAIGLLALILSFSSCITILQEVANQNNITSDERVPGVWKDGYEEVVIQRFNDADNGNFFREARKGGEPIAKEDSLFFIKHYLISFQKNGVNYRSLGALFRIENSTFLNLLPEECLDKSGKNMIPENAFPGSILAKVEWQGNTTVLIRFLNGDNIKKLVLEGKVRISSQYDPLFGTFLITASSSEIEQFLTKYRNDERLYSGGLQLICKKS